GRACGRACSRAAALATGPRALEPRRRTYRPSRTSTGRAPWSLFVRGHRPRSDRRIATERRVSAAPPRVRDGSGPADCQDGRFYDQVGSARHQKAFICAEKGAEVTTVDAPVSHL